MLFFFSLNLCFSSALYWAPPPSCSPAFVFLQLWYNSTYPLLLVVLEGRVLFSSSGLYQLQLWNPRFAEDTNLSQQGKHWDAGWMWGRPRQITRERNVMVVNGIDLHQLGRKEWASLAFAICQVWKYSVFLLWGNEESSDSGEKMIVLWWKGVSIWHDTEQLEGSSTT